MKPRLVRAFPGCLAACAVFVAALAVFHFLSGCEAVPSSHSSAGNARVPGWISLERTGGAIREAPVYLVTLYEDGGVLFEGRANVRRKGTFAKHIPPERAAAVFTQLEAIDFWNRDPRYDVERATKGTGESLILKTTSMDVPWDIITARHRNRFKRIDGLFFAPHELIDLKTLIEKTVDLPAWINGTGDEQRP